jgi:hypothetical protein
MYFENLLEDRYLGTTKNPNYIHVKVKQRFIGGMLSAIQFTVSQLVFFYLVSVISKQVCECTALLVAVTLLYIIAKCCLLP